MNVQDSSDSFTQICVVGMGYVGSSLSALFAEQGLNVRGIDINSEVTKKVNSGVCPIEEDRISELFEEHANESNITATTSYDVIDDCEVIIVTVGTPLAREDPDLSGVEKAASQIGSHLKEDDMVVFRSTLPAGVTEDTIRPILNEESELVAGEDYALAFCPERMAEGNAYSDLTSLPVVVGGLTQSCQRQVEALWEQLDQETVSMSSPRAAELTKLADNWWIDLNIALANEIALLSEQVGVDALEVIHAANTLPKGDHNVNILYPGTGVGGSCLVKDPRFVANLGNEHGLDLRTPRVSREVNEQMPDHFVDLVKQGVDDFKEATVAVLGYAFKSETDDTRNTPAKPVIESLLERNVDVQVTDPYVSGKTVEEELGIEPVRLVDALDGTDVVAIVTGHAPYRELSPESLTEYVGCEDFTVVDGRHVFEPDAFESANVRYLGVGRDTDE